MGSLCRWIGILWIATLAATAPARATFVFTYDFPGTPGSGVASAQTNPTQPGNATFGDWARVNVVAGTTADVFDGTFWNNTSTFDNTQYESFSVTASSGYHLDLAGTLVFDQLRSSGGPTKGRVDIFLNGSATLYDTYNYNPGASWKTETFNFTPTVDADNVTSVEFRFYGWNGGTPEASLFLDNVTLTLDVVPEWNTGIASAFLIAFVVWYPAFRKTTLLLRRWMA